MSRHGLKSDKKTNVCFGFCRDFFLQCIPCKVYSLCKLCTYYLIPYAAGMTPAQL